MIVHVPQYYLYAERSLVAFADRDRVLRVFHQVFDELGMKVHKESSAYMIHWPGGFGRATRAVAALISGPESYYCVQFESLGMPGFTTVRFGAKQFYSRWFKGKEKAQEKISAFFKKIETVSSEHDVSFIDQKQFELLVQKS